MKLALLIFIAATTIFVYGFYNQALFFLGYLWASLLYPQAFTRPYLSAIPISMIFGLFTIFAFFARAKERQPVGKMPVGVYVVVGFAIWVTFTTLIARLPHDAWTKWDWAFKSILIAVAMPIFVRTRLQLEATVIVAFSALFAHIATAGFKTALGTGGYDRLGTLLQTNFWLGETSTLALAAIMSLPIAWYIVRHSQLMAHIKKQHRMLMFAAYVPLAVACVIGTSARTGLVAFGVLLLMGVKGILKKVVVVALGMAFLVYGTPLMPDWWQERMGTIQNYKDDTSAMTRLTVWGWASNYAVQNPLGGGFGVFKLSEIVTMVGADGEHKLGRAKQEEGRAAHSVYFEIIGEHGYFGLLLYLCILGGALLNLFRLSTFGRMGENTPWAKPLAHSLFAALVVYAAGSAFIGIGFQPLFWPFLGMYYCLYRITRVPVVKRSGFQVPVAPVAPHPAGVLSRGLGR